MIASDKNYMIKILIKYFVLLSRLFLSHQVSKMPSHLDIGVGDLNVSTLEVCDNESEEVCRHNDTLIEGVLIPLVVHTFCFSFLWHVPQHQTVLSLCDDLH